MADFNLDSAGCGLANGEVNVSYQVYPAFRGRGFAGRAVSLLVEFLATIPGAGSCDAGASPTTSYTSSPTAAG